MTVKYNKLRISKIAAAHRQLDCAIELWFFDKDEVSIHTLAAAAYQIIHDVNQHKGKPGHLLYDSQLIAEEHRRQWTDLIKKPINFFKHADNDPEGIVEFVPSTNFSLMAFAIIGLEILGEPRSNMAAALIAWLNVHEQHLLSEESRKLIAQNVHINNLQQIRALSKKDFLKEVLRLQAELRANSFG